MKQQILIIDCEADVTSRIDALTADLTSDQLRDLLQSLYARGATPSPVAISHWRLRRGLGNPACR